MSTKIFSACLASLLTCCLPFPIFSTQLKCEVSAPSAILINADTGAVLFEKNAYKQTYPASTTKIATALYALYSKGSFLDEIVTASHESVAAVSPVQRRSSGKHPSHRLEFGGSHMNLKVGEALPLKSLLYGLLVCSGNDAANAISMHVSGSVPTFMADLNRYLKSIGCKNTHFTNPHGLPDPFHVTTAYDLALMTSHALRFPIFKQIVKTTRYTRPKSNKQDETSLFQSNALLKPGKFYYPHAIGVKTGYTASAGSNLVAAAENEGRRVIAVALNCEDSGQRYRSCIAMFEAAFNEQKMDRKLFAKETDTFRKQVLGGKVPLQAHLLNDVIIDYYPSEEPSLQAGLIWYDMTLPIRNGDIVGEIKITSLEGKILRVDPIFAKDEVLPTVSHQTRLYLSLAKSWVTLHKELLGGLLGGCFLVVAVGLRPRRRTS